MPAGAWGKKPSDAIRAPPPAGERNQSSGNNRNSNNNNRDTRNNRDNRTNNSNNNSNNNRQGGGRGGGRGRGGGGRGRGRQNNNNNNNNNYQRTILNVDMLAPGDGKTPEQKAVTRITAAQLLELRLEYLEISAEKQATWNPPKHCAWVDEGRIEAISGTTNTPSKLGDVSRTRRAPVVKETAPPIEDCKPLEVNDETRWKSRAFEGEVKEGDAEEEISDELVLKKALLILNKLSLTKFEKLSDEFVATGIGRNPACLGGAVGIIVDKAQSEPHFASMYAKLCFKLSRMAMPVDEIKNAGKAKAFKKLLLSRCQSEFEEQMSDKVEKAIKGVDDVDEQKYLIGLLKKMYLGHMRFIGELYKGDLIKLDVMLFCLNALLMESYEEENVECFTKLMATIGFPLEHQSAIMEQQGRPGPQEQLDACWNKIDEMINGGEVSNRIKFMLQDLKEMKNNGWVTRRKEEQAKTLDQIQKDVAREEAQAARRSSQSSSSSSSRNNHTRRSTNDLRKSATADKDGFMPVMPMSRSSGNLMRSSSDARPSPMNKPKKIIRAQSFTINPNRKRTNSPPSTGGGPRRTYGGSGMPSAPTLTEGKVVLAPKEVAAKAKNILKEYFVSGETADSVMSIDELVGPGTDGADERAAKVIESCILLVLERKDTEVQKMLVVLKEAHAQKKIPDNAFAAGLNDPLEFLSDIEIDAPLASKFLAKIIASFIQMKALELDFLLSAPEPFRMDGKPGMLAARAVVALGGEVLATHTDIVGKLMTSAEKEKFDSPTALIDSVK